MTDERWALLLGGPCSGQRVQLRGTSPDQLEVTHAADACDAIYRIDRPAAGQLDDVDLVSAVYRFVPPT